MFFITNGLAKENASIFSLYNIFTCEMQLFLFLPVKYMFFKYTLFNQYFSAFNCFV